MARGVEAMLVRSLRVVELPATVERQVAAVLASPLVAAISVVRRARSWLPPSHLARTDSLSIALGLSSAQVRFLLPDFEALIPAPLLRPSTLAPVMFVLLLGFLFFGQALPLLLFGLAGGAVRPKWPPETAAVAGCRAPGKPCARTTQASATSWC